MNQTVVCYDLDGTLIDSSSSIYKSLGFACEKEDVEIPDYKKFKSHIGPPLNVYLKKLLNVDNITQKKIIQSFRKHHDSKGYLSYLLFDEALYTLNYFKKKGVKQYLITNKPPELTSKALHNLGIFKFFEKIYSSNNYESKKKSKSFYIQELKSKNNTLYYVGDTKSDKEETKKTKSFFIFANYGYGKVDDPDFEINKLTQLIKIIKH